MDKSNFPIWSNETDKAIIEINRVTSQIKGIQNKLITNNKIPYNRDFRIFLNNVRQTLDFWTGCTYVGFKKEKSIQKSFQTFFEALYDFLLTCLREDKSFCHRLKNFANETLYRGTIYRYLGHSSNDKNSESKIKPEYNNIYVSWSKIPDNHYIQSKLYGTKTLMTCVIAEHFYGIDLEVFGVVRGAEAEVVFPTFKEMVTNIQYLD